MTTLLESALRRVESLSVEEQDAIAAQILESLDNEEAWEQSFRNSATALARLAAEASEEHEQGKTRPIDKLIQ